MEKTVYITSHWSSYSKEFQYSVQGYAPSPEGEFVLVEERVLHFETPNDIELRAQVAAALRRKKSKVLADAHVEVKEIEERIQELLALEDKSK